MKILIDVNARLIFVAAGCGLVAAFALHAAYPGIFKFWPDSSQDLAAWVQAIGVIIALCITILVATWPRKQAVQNSVAQAKSFVIILYKYLYYIRRICPGGHVDLFRLYASIIRDLMVVNEDLNYGLLPVNIVVQCYEFRIAGVLVEEFARELEKNKNSTNLSNLYEQLEVMSVFLEEGLRIVIDESNSILGVQDSFENIMKSISAGTEIAVKKGKAIGAAVK